MAKLMLIGDMARVEILPYPEDEELVLARCFEHRGGSDFFVEGCGWWETYDTVDDATQYAADHADRGAR